MSERYCYKIWRTQGERGIDRLIFRYLITDGDGLPLWHTTTRRGARRYIRRRIQREMQRRSAGAKTFVEDVTR